MSTINEKVKKELVLPLHNDASHGWVEVDISELNRLGITDKISGYSYQHGNKVYLEEDDDLGIFLSALVKEGKITVRIEEASYDHESFVRGLRRYGT